MPDISDRIANAMPFERAGALAARERSVRTRSTIMNPAHPNRSFRIVATYQMAGSETPSGPGPVEARLPGRRPRQDHIPPGSDLQAIRID
jgi:hypothetical protein